MVTWRVSVAALIMAICLSVIGYAIFPTAPHRDGGLHNVKLPDRRPSNAAWVWPDGVPGWAPGETIKGFPLTTVQSVELQAAELAAARHGLDASDIHVVDSIRGDRQGVLAILATQTLYQTPTRTCLAGLLRGDTPVQWVCPSAHVLSHKHVFLVATRLRWPSLHDPVYLAGVARGDVARIVLIGGASGRQTIYTSSKTWGEFESAQVTSPTARLLVFGGGRLLETVPLDVPVGQQRVLR